jgi:hypothetical protein
MAKSTDTRSAKSSIISSRAASLKKTIKSSAKAISRPFKKVKQSFSIRSASRSMASRSSTALPPSDNDDDDDHAKSVTDEESARKSSQPEVELTPEQELGMSFDVSLLSDTHYLF